MPNSSCPFCQREIQNPHTTSLDITLYTCDNCGKFGLTEELALFELTHIPDEDKIKISHLLLEHKLTKKPTLILSMRTCTNSAGEQLVQYTEFLKSYPKDASELLDRIFLNLSRTIERPAQKIYISRNNLELLFTNDVEEVSYITRQLSNSNYISPVDSLPAYITIESDGWTYLKELQQRPEGQQAQVFVAMWFDDRMDKIYEEGIKKAIEDATSYKPVRIDNLDHNNKICDQIISEIKKSQFVVADFTGQRGGVYFEAGYAQGRNIPVIWTVKKSDVADLHFDTRQYNHIVYENPEDLYIQLKSRIEATIE